ncbi:MAG TPA: hypothetical protein VFG71_03190, partial [Nitrospiraceae bacterium]|nr:hypothetical protein [Nitrospiraceae bacterium]
ARVQAQIQHCAERVLFRLEMWNLAPHGRLEAPMPPATALQRLDLSPQQWADHRDLALLKSYSAGLATAQEGKPARFETLAAKGYDQLRTCLPSVEPTIVGAVANQK